MAAARKSSRYGHRDATMILLGYRHGLRAAELCDFQWSQVELPGCHGAGEQDGAYRLGDADQAGELQDSRDDGGLINRSRVKRAG